MINHRGHSPLFPYYRVMRAESCLELTEQAESTLRNCPKRGLSSALMVDLASIWRAKWSE